jgi:hypothetical protein
VRNLGKFLQGIFLIIPVSYPDDRREESAAWSGVGEANGRSRKKGLIKCEALLILRIKGEISQLNKKEKNWAINQIDF